MSAGEKPSVGYVTIWAWLVMLVALGVAVLAVPVSKTVAVLLIFGVAAVKATLVIRHYMHVRRQPLMVYAMLGIPVVLAIAMTLALLPDIGFRH
jgi:caa(3)-type oxidase subunit IV